MQNCVYNGEELNLLDFTYDKDHETNKKNELFLRNASKSGELRCLDCGSVLTYKSSELITQHFAHKKGTLKDCPYSEYTKSQNEKLRLAKEFYIIISNHYSLM